MDESPPVEYRKYKDGDLEACRCLWEQLTITHRTIYDNPSIGGSDPGKFFDGHLDKVGADGIWVADAQGTIVGLMGLEVEDDEMTIEPLVVDQSWRGRGIGSRLMEIAVQEATRLCATYLNVKPVARNIEAFRFFTDNGMLNIGHVELFIDLKNREWKDGLRLHDIDLRY